MSRFGIYLTAPTQPARCLFPESCARNRRAIALIISLVAFVIFCAQITRPRAHASNPQSPLERDLDGNSLQSYRMTLTGGQFIRAVFDQRGIDVVVTLSDPNQEKLLEVDNPLGAWGPEILFFEVPQSGSYLLEVRPRKPTAPPGRYRFTLEARQPTAADRNRLAAERVFAAATQMFMTDSATSARNATVKYGGKQASLPAGELSAGGNYFSRLNR